MPIYQVLCPDCGHRFGGMVFAGTREPEKWVCSQCGGDRAQYVRTRSLFRIRLKCNMGRDAPVAAGEARGSINSTRYVPVETREVHDTDAASAFLQLFEQ